MHRLRILPHTRRRHAVLACVLGDIDLVRPLAHAGIHSAVVAPPGDPARYSRATVAALPWVDPWERPDELVAQLLAFARRQERPPVLYYQDDRSLVLVSRHREQLATAFRFVIPDAELVEGLADKSRFIDVADAHGLPVPATVRLTAGEPLPDGELPEPALVKPLTRRGFDEWARITAATKAARVGSRAELARLWDELGAAGVDAVVQELVEGPETAIESYHVYVDVDGLRVAEFTGRKIRTRPHAYGFSTAVEVVPLDDVRDLGRDIVGRLGLRGVAKLDFKRRRDGALVLLEVNPRFTLWHHPAALAGVNIPALVHADATGTARLPTAATAGRVTWCQDIRDALAAREQGVPIARWLAFAAGCDSRSAFSVTDPEPFVRGVLWERVRRRPA